MSRIEYFSNPAINSAVNKMYGQVYVLTDLQEKLERSNQTEVDIDGLITCLSFSVEVAREVVGELHKIGFETSQYSIEHTKDANNSGMNNTLLTMNGEKA